MKRNMLIGRCQKCKKPVTQAVKTSDFVNPITGQPGHVAAITAQCCGKKVTRYIQYDNFQEHD